MGRIAAVPSEDVKPLGKRLEDRRLELGLSQAEAAEKIGKSQPTWSRYEAGGPVPLSLQSKIARFLGVSVKRAQTLILETQDEDEVEVEPDVSTMLVEARGMRAQMERAALEALDAADPPALPQPRRGSHSTRSQAR